MGIRERGRGVGRACAGCTRTGRSRRAPSTTQVSTGQSTWRVCVEKCPLTMRHTVTRSGDSCGSATYVPSIDETTEGFGGIATRKPNDAEYRARSHPYSGPQQERTRVGWRREREQPERPGSGQLPGAARGGGEWCWGPVDHSQHVKQRA